MNAALLPYVQLETGANPDAAIIWLHGLGADGNDFVPIVQEMRLPKAVPIRFIFPHAPVRPVTLNGGMPMRAWYDVYAANLADRADLVGVRASQAQIDALIAAQRAQGVEANRIIVAGFSQGGAIALYAGLRYAERLAGIIALSTYLIRGDQLVQEGAAVNRAVPIFMAHGTMDEMVRPEWGNASRQALAEQGYRVEWHTYPMAHSVVWEEIEAISVFLSRVLTPL
jgi:phospholipase/carboxylesterase